MQHRRANANPGWYFFIDDGEDGYYQRIGEDQLDIVMEFEGAIDDVVYVNDSGFVEKATNTSFFKKFLADPMVLRIVRKADLPEEDEVVKKNVKPRKTSRKMRMEGFVRVAPDKKKAKSMLKMVNTTIDMINTIDITRFPSNFIKDSYEAIRGLMSIILLLDGYDTSGEGAHVKLSRYLEHNYYLWEGSTEIALINELRAIRNKISYDGFFVDKDYVERKSEDIEFIIDRLKIMVEGKLM